MGHFLDLLCLLFLGLLLLASYLHSGFHIAATSKSAEKNV